MGDQTANLQAFLDPGEKRPGERVLGAIPYGLSATLVITNQRIVGKTGPRLERQPVGFVGEIAYTDIVAVDYLAGIPVVGSPGLRIQFRRPDGSLQEAVLRFPGQLNAFLLYKLSGFNPRRIYRLISEQLERRNYSGSGQSLT